MSARRFEVYAPLQDFLWEGDDFELAPNLWIRRFTGPPDISGLHEWIAKDEWDRASGAAHWLIFDWIDGTFPSPAEVTNLMLLSLWLVKPTRSYIAFRFELGRDAAGSEKARRRMLDRFAWVTGAIHADIEDMDLKSASAYYSALVTSCRARARLNDALLLTIAGCWSHAWQVALICHAAAAETLLTYETGRGITGRLAKSYACLTESDSTKRDAAYREFSTLYSARSDIMHGRTHNVVTTDRLPTLIRFQEVLRRLWRVVLTTPSLSAVLEGTDAQRKAHLHALEAGYTPGP